MTRRGFSLIELMMAMGITSVVIAGISIILVKQSQASVKQTQQRTLEETGRQALLEIAYAVRMAGSGIDPTAAFDFDRYACGDPPNAATCNNNRGVDTPPTPATPGSRDRNDGPDELVVSYRDPSFARDVKAKSGTGPYAVTLDRPLKAGTTINQGRIAMLLCSGADPVAYVAFAADAVPIDPQTVSLRQVTPADGYYPQTAPTDPCFASGSLVLVERVRYFVANDFDKVPALFRDRNRGGSPQVLYRGIEDLQLVYTIGPGTAAGPVPCGTGWDFGSCNQGIVPRNASLALKPDFWISEPYDHSDRFLADPANIRAVQINLVARSTTLSPDKAGDPLPALANRPAPAPDPAHPYARTVLSITEQPTNLLSRARMMPIAAATGGG
jgi:prepilin-type N-terminal cleavage/methylation domain-containing protein